MTERTDPTATPVDPFGVDVPAEWNRTLTAESAVYETPTTDLRVEVRELSNRLSLYWWVDVYERVAGKWTHHEVGVEETFRDPTAAAAAAQSVVDRVVDGVGLPSNANAAGDD